MKILLIKCKYLLINGYYSTIINFTKPKPNHINHGKETTVQNTDNLQRFCKRKNGNRGVRQEKSKNHNKGST